MTLKNTPARLRERRAEQSLLCPRRANERVGARTDVAIVGGIEGRKIFEEDLTSAEFQKMRGRGLESRHGLDPRRDPSAQSDNDRLAVAEGIERTGIAHKIA